MNTPLSQRTPANSPFAILYQPRMTAQAIRSRQPLTAAQRTSLVLTTNKYSELGKSTIGAGDRAASIRKGGI